MNINLTAFKITFLKDMGELSQQKMDLLVKEFSVEFPIKNVLPVGILLFKNSSIERHSLFVSPNQITVSQEGVNIEPNSKFAKICAKRIYDKFYLGYNCQGICDFSTLIPGGSLEISKGFAGQDFSDIPQLKGIGLRFIIEDSEFNGDFRYEPYLPEPSKFFCEMEGRLLKATDIRDVAKKSEELLEMFKGLINKVYYKYN